MNEILNQSSRIRKFAARNGYRRGIFFCGPTAARIGLRRSQQRIQADLPSNCSAVSQTQFWSFCETRLSEFRAYLNFARMPVSVVVASPRCRRAVRSRIAPLETFARQRRPHVAGILVHCRWPLGPNLIEGINNRFKVIKRMAYGFRDDARLFLKIGVAAPGIR